MKTTTHFQYSGYMYFPEVLRRVLDCLETAIIESVGDDGPQALAFRGISGASLAFPMSERLGLPLLHIRKPGSHSQFVFEGNLTVDRYAIVDDFAETGITLRTIVKEVSCGFMSHGAPAPRLTDVFLVGNRDYDYGDPGYLTSLLPENSVRYHGLSEICMPALGVKSCG